jgi:hypothetical protein
MYKKGLKWYAMDEIDKEVHTLLYNIQEVKWRSAISKLHNHFILRSINNNLSFSSKLFYLITGKNPDQ